nr:hypothetical protein [Tanacetum cinerariifolium]
SKDSPGDGFKPLRKEEKKDTKDPRNEDNEVLSTEEPKVKKEKDSNVNSTNNINIVSPTDNAAGIKDNVIDKHIVYGCADNPNMPNLEEIGQIEEEVYVYQPSGFEDPEFPDRFYKVEKALYGLHQAPRAWYETLSTYLLDNGFHRGQIDKTLFINRVKGDILLVQVYVDDIIFGSTRKEMSLQVKHKEDGIFISQDKYVNEILNKFGYSDVKTASTPIETHKTLLKDEKGEDVDEHLYRFMIGSLMYLTSLRPDIMFAIASTPMETHKTFLKDEKGEGVDEHLYRSMIGSLLYLTSSRPDIMFVICACARFQVNPKISHLHAVKKFFRYLKGQHKLGLWYLKDLPFDLVAYTDSDYAGASLDRKSITGGCQFLGCSLISYQCKKQTVAANSIIKAKI